METRSEVGNSLKVNSYAERTVLHWSSFQSLLSVAPFSPLSGLHVVFKWFGDCDIHMNFKLMKFPLHCFYADRVGKIGIYIGGNFPNFLVIILRKTRPSLSSISFYTPRCCLPNDVFFFSRSTE